jgi:hypothetical protein
LLISSLERGDGHLGIALTSASVSLLITIFGFMPFLSLSAQRPRYIG